jgi:hypothetical protein
MNTISTAELADKYFLNIAADKIITKQNANDISITYGAMDFKPKTNTSGASSNEKPTGANGGRVLSGLAIKPV